MNPNTRVVVHCYEGDAQQVRDTLPVHLSHGCPVTILSPDDSRVVIEHPGVDCKWGGPRAAVPSGARVLSIGQGSLDRQRKHMEILLTYPENFFLMNDADSICLSPQLPDYLYAEPDVLWSNLVYDPMPKQQVGYPPDFPRLAFQPPYFLSRRTIEALLAVADQVRVNPVMPYIDHYMVQLAVKARHVWKGFPDGRSTPISMAPGDFEYAQVDVRHNGKIFIHSVKEPRFWQPLVKARQQYLDDYRPQGDHRLAPDVNTTADVRPVGRELARDQAPGPQPPPPPPRRHNPAVWQKAPRSPSIVRSHGVRA